MQALCADVDAVSSAADFVISPELHVFFQKEPVWDRASFREIDCYTFNLTEAVLYSSRKFRLNPCALVSRGSPRSF